jgi:putative ribosome biogenesis GTPase RsgA
MRLRLDDGSEVTGRLKGKKIRPVCGDLVEAHVIANEPEWLITNILPRKNELSRPDKRGRAETLAANIDLVAVVTADAPAADWFIVDRYLAAAELINVSALVVFNKTDLGRCLGGRTRRSRENRLPNGALQREKWRQPGQTAAWSPRSYCDHRRAVRGWQIESDQLPDQGR